MDILIPNQVVFERIELQTSKHKNISNRQLLEIPVQEMRLCQEYKQKYPLVTIKTKPNPVYNCHGFTFASSRTGIEEDSVIYLILEDDNYQEIERNDVIPGDIIIYKYNGGIIHSGIVISRPYDLGFPDIISKWGSYGEVIHNALNCPYNCSDLHYYRKQ